MKKKVRLRVVKVGVVTSVAMDKTILVSVDRMVQHRFYEKFVRRTTKFMAHDGKNECHIGDKVRIVACRPLSKSKRWRLQEIIARAVQV